MTVARDFEDDDREFGGAAVRAALDASRWPWPESAPYDVPTEDAGEMPIKATAFVWRAEADIPKRRWVYGKHLIRQYLSLDVAAGGVGKSATKIGESLAMASGRELYGKALPEGPLAVWFYNLEDPAEETERRVHATAKYFQIAPSDVDGRLYTDSGRDQPLCIAVETEAGTRIVTPVVEALVAEIKARGIDVLIVDPFVSSHEVSENDNGAIDKVAKLWAQIAHRCDCSINIVHHVRKQNGSEVSAESSRGAVSLIGAARSVMVYNRMTKDEAEMAGIKPEMAGFHFRIHNDKANLAPPEAADWYRMNNVDLDNGDEVGVACPWQWPDSFAGITKDKLKAVQRAVAEGEWRKDVRSAQWVGNIIASVLAMDPEDDRKRLASIIKQWVKTDVLREVEKDGPNRKSFLFVEVGTWVVD